MRSGRIYQRVKAFKTNSHDGASLSKFGHTTMVVMEAATPAAKPRAVIDDAVVFFGTSRTNLRQKLGGSLVHQLH